MKKELLKWNIYEISSENESLHGVRFRGRIRKLGILNGINILAENVVKKDGENKVRFAVLNGEGLELIKNFVKKIFPSSRVELVMKNIENPVLSRLQINDPKRSQRYEVE